MASTMVFTLVTSERQQMLLEMKRPRQTIMARLLLRGSNRMPALQTLSLRLIENLASMSPQVSSHPYSSTSPTYHWSSKRSKKQWKNVTWKKATYYNSNRDWWSLLWIDHPFVVSENKRTRTSVRSLTGPAISTSLRSRCHEISSIIEALSPLNLSSNKRRQPKKSKKKRRKHSSI